MPSAHSLHGTQGVNLHALSRHFVEQLAGVGDAARLAVSVDDDRRRERRDGVRTRSGGLFEEVGGGVEKAVTACRGAARGREAAARSAKGTASRRGVMREASSDLAAAKRRAARSETNPASGVAGNFAGAAAAVAAGDSESDAIGGGARWRGEKTSESKWA
uniref:Uncharacterized protein n=1 Tax=Oryza meridionalis TaxID=40149 RepID=A0A0E0EG03_9ORYZ